ncbi:MAG: hypothetical protein KC609_22460 [Myxococcales bacterium]|nr:hypothetical protein [Myxococcales bacterium]
MIEWIGAVAGATLFVLGGGLLWRARRREREIYRQIVTPLLQARRGFENPRVVRRYGPEPEVILRGRFHNRNFEAAVKIFMRERRARLQITLDVPQVFALEIRRKGTNRGRIVASLAVDHGRIDKRYQVKADDTFQALILLNQEKIPNLLDQLFSDALQLLTLKRGKLVATYYAKTLAEVVERETVPFHITLLAWLTETMLQIELTKGPKNSAAALEDVFCPFCRSPLLDAETTVDDLVACLKCGAPHHRECWDENATCSVFGCEARVDECKALQR